MTRTVAEHLQIVTEALPTADSLGTEEITVRAALHRVVVADVMSPVNLPVFRNSQMDGYAVRSTDVAAVPATLPVHGTVAAGDGPRDLPVGAAIKIMTGAPLPTGADCVVPVEDTTTDGAIVTVQRGRTAGEFVREPGSDVRNGDLLVPAGRRLGVQHIAALAAAGVGTVPVRRRLRAAVITTGAELVPAGTPLGPGQIYDSNGTSLATAITASEGEVTAVTHSIDDAPTFLATLREAASGADVVFTSGGVSMGDFEVVREALTPLGGWFAHVAMQPGGPQGLTVVDGIPVISFPGNPVSTLVSFEIFARPTLRALAGLAPLQSEPLPLCADLVSPAGKQQFLRGHVTQGGVELVSGPGSHLIAAMARADVLIEVPAEVTALDAGTSVQVWPL
ncbi:molybdopterin molybdotransferase MoeA [Aldersonia sp. NBC_00410]|uniref:molybdopterin molybdotransferase MoeA n=1 Tax=Aldersonia sp. NBC_00410 TaxID=2975954 RepID=UPI00225B7822|nr:gephyrin-like molybdotransferase Glp [Aldersonia sp. NBC_00410]MCX5044800.1 molybdopterin molybdotransferase MoeA [Aldersonia sp. NBC_00410]